MKALLIGGTGTISFEVTKQLAAQGHDVTLLNRGSRTDDVPPEVRVLNADVRDQGEVRAAIGNETFDVVADFIAFEPKHVEQDFDVFDRRTRQYIFVSSASAYQKPLSDYRVTESTPLANPYWEYSRNKIACEELLMKFYRDYDFPITIVRPSHTYSNHSVPVGVHGAAGSWQVLKRMLNYKPVIIHGDGTSLWTLTHSRDFAKGFIGLMGNLHAIGEAVHITSDETVTWNQVHKVIAATLSVELQTVHVASDFLRSCSHEDLDGPLHGDKANSVVFDNSKLKRLVPDFVATTRVDQGVAEAVRYVLDHPELQVEDPRFDDWCDRVIYAIDRAVDTVYWADESARGFGCQ